MADPAVLAERLELLRRLWVPERLDERPDPTVEPVDRDLSPAAIARRLDDLRALWRLTRWAHDGRVKAVDLAPALTEEPA